MFDFPSLSKNRLKDLTKLQQKKFRLLNKQVIVEGLRLLKQLECFDIKPLEVYQSNPVDSEVFIGTPHYYVPEHDLYKLCESESPPKIAGLYPTPEARDCFFLRALLLDSISDPGNLGTIFRIASAFSIDCIFLTKECCEVSSPKVIRSSLGAVYKVPFQYVEYDQINKMDAIITCLDMNGETSISDYIVPDSKTIYALGSEAHGLSKQILNIADQSIRIEMNRKMESLNVAVSAGILAHHIFKFR